MINKLKKSISNPRKAFRYLNVAIKHRIKKKRGILFFLGMDVRGEFSILYPGYKMCYGFEANPDRYKKLIQKYGKYDNIKILNVSVADYDGEIEFNISNNNDGASSSVGNFSEDWQNNQTQDGIRMIKKIKVPCINLLHFCKENNISYIDDYISDIQGMDLHVLKTLRPLIEKKLIGSIRCEVTKNNYRNIYYDLPDNSENGFKELLNDNYQLIAKGLGILKDGKFDIIPEHTWEMDCKWRKITDI